MTGPVTLVIACSRRKAPHPAAARDLYTGPVFRQSLAAALAEAARYEAGGTPARVLVLSARYGLITLDEVIAPYDLRMGRPGSVTAQAVALQATALGIGPDCEVRALLPRPYLAVLAAAVGPLGARVHDLYQGARGIGDQKHVNATLKNHPHQAVT
jgi:hypothetical protein